MSKNEELFLRAQKTTPGGVNSPVRAFRQVGGVPRFIKRAQGAYFWDADDKKYIDCIGSWGPTSRCNQCISYRLHPKNKHPAHASQNVAHHPLDETLVLESSHRPAWFFGLLKIMLRSCS